MYKTDSKTGVAVPESGIDLGSIENLFCSGTPHFPSKGDFSKKQAWHNDPNSIPGSHTDVQFLKTKKMKKLILMLVVALGAAHFTYAGNEKPVKQLLTIALEPGGDDGTIPPTPPPHFPK